MLMIHCKKASELTSKKHDEGLSLLEHIKLIIHNFMCVLCANFEKQTAAISAAVRKLYGDIESAEAFADENQDLVLSCDAKQRIRDVVSKNLGTS